MRIRTLLRSDYVRVGGLLAVLAALPQSIALGQAGPPPCTGQQIVFDTTGTVQQFVVPAGVSSITIDAAGAQGAAARQPAPGPPFHVGGNGARLIASFPVTAGETLRVVVGEAGQSDPIGYVGGGGGGSFVYRTPDLAGLLIAAAGGGGGSAGSPGVPGSASTTASNGESNDFGTGGVAGTGGNGGGAGVSPGGCAGGGGGGLLTDGGDDSSPFPGCVGTGGRSVANGSAGGTGGGPGGFGGGGNGEIIDFGGGSGGGGGFNGGGGGGSGVNNLGPMSGGGGGSFSATVPIFAATGTQTGNGALSFCFTQAPLAVPALDPRGLFLLCAALALLGAWTLRRQLADRR